MRSRLRASAGVWAIRLINCLINSSQDGTRQVRGAGQSAWASGRRGTGGRPQPPRLSAPDSAPSGPGGRCTTLPRSPAERSPPAPRRDTPADRGPRPWSRARRPPRGDPSSSKTQELLVTLRRVDAERREAAEIRLAIEGVLDGVSGRVVFGGDAGTPALDGGHQERQAPAVVRAKLGEGFGESGAGTPRDRSAQSLPCHADRRYRLVASSKSPAMIEPGPP